MQKQSQFWFPSIMSCVVNYMLDRAWFGWTIIIMVGRKLLVWTRILVQVTINRRLLIGRDDHLDQSEAYDLS